MGVRNACGWPSKKTNYLREVKYPCKLHQQKVVLASVSDDKSLMCLQMWLTEQEVSGVLGCVSE